MATGDRRPVPTRIPPDGTGRDRREEIVNGWLSEWATERRELEAAERRADEAMGEVERLRNERDDNEARIAELQNAAWHRSVDVQRWKRRAARWKALARRLRGRWYTLSEMYAKATKRQHDRVRELEAALREIERNPCLDPEGNAAIARAALSEKGDSDG